MLSLTNEEMGTYYSSVRLIPSPEYGRQLFVEKNCIVCHTIGGVGAKTGPDLFGVMKRHSSEWLDEQLVNPELVYPGSSMPEYDLETNARKALVAFLSSATSEDVHRSCRRTASLTPEDVSRSRQAGLCALWLRRLSRHGTTGWRRQSQCSGRGGAFPAACLRRLYQG